MKIKGKLFKSLISVGMILFILISQCFSIEVYAEVSNSGEVNGEEVVLFQGETFARGGWDPWETLVEIKDFNVNDFRQQFVIEVEYEGELAPYVIFQSWTGGTSWAQVKASFTSKGVAYYSYDAFSEEYGSDFSTLNMINVKPGGTDVTITSVKVKSQVNEGISVKYEGKAGEIVNDINVGWSLGNTLDGLGDWISKYTDGTPEDYETAWKNPVTTKKMILKVKEAGFNAIRIPITWNPHIDDKNGYEVDKAWMDRVQEVVDYVMEEDMYCIINVHNDVGEYGWLHASEKSLNNGGEKFKSLWKQIATRFKGYNDNLLFEGFNEMLDESFNWQYPGKEATNSVNKYNQMFVDTVRSTGGNNAKRCLVVNTYAANTDNNVLDDFVLPKDTAQNSLIVQIHSYTPYEYANVIGEKTSQTEWKENGGKALIDGILSNIYYHFTSKNIPVIMGEIAAANKNNTDDRCEYASYVVSNSKKFGIKCLWWDDGGKFEIDETYGFETGMGLLNRYTLEWVYPEVVKAFTGVNPEDINA